MLGVHVLQRPLCSVRRPVACLILECGSARSWLLVGVRQGGKWGPCPAICVSTAGILVQTANAYIYADRAVGKYHQEVLKVGSTGDVHWRFAASCYVIYFMYVVQ